MLDLSVLYPFQLFHGIIMIFLPDFLMIVCDVNHFSKISLSVCLGEKGHLIIYQCLLLPTLDEIADMTYVAS